MKILAFVSTELRWALFSCIEPHLDNILTVGITPRDYAKGDPNKQLDPWYVVGIADGEGNFSIVAHYYPNKTFKGFTFSFKVTQKARNAGILWDMQRFFGVGTVVIDNRVSDTLKYHVTNVQDIQKVIIPFFDKYRLVTSKQLNYLDWRKAVMLPHSKNPQQTLDIKDGMNMGRSFADKFCYLLNVKPIVLEPQWLLGFAEGESSFYLSINTEKKTRATTYIGIDFSFEVSQSAHDVAVLDAICQYFGDGSISPKFDLNSLVAAQLATRKTIYKLRQTDKVLNFFDQYQLLTDKWLDYCQFKKAYLLKQEGAHKTPEGLAAIKDCRNNMNSSRIGNLPKVL